MKVKYFLFNILILIVLTNVSCDYKTETNKITDTGVVSDDSQANSIDEPFTLDDIKSFILDARSLEGKLYEGDVYSSSKRIGTVDGTDVYEHNGQYNTFDKVIDLFKDYYSPDVVEKVLVRNGFVNLHGTIGIIGADGEPAYWISNQSRIRMIIDEEDKKVVDMEEFGDEEDSEFSEYTLIKQDSGKWIITDISGCFSYDESEKELFYNDEFTLNEANDIDYEIYFEKYIVKNEDKQTDILIEYPQLKNMKSLDMQKKVNKLLSDKAISDYKGDGVDGLSLSMKTKVEYANSNIISVKYTGFAYYPNTANGYDVMYATNINLKTGEVIDIHNLFTDGFKQKLNRDVFIYNCEDKVVEDQFLSPYSFEYGYLNAEESIIIEMFENYYCNKAIDKYYFSKKYFNIIVETTSGPAIYLELATSYEELKDCMNYEDEFWNELF